MLAAGFLNLISPITAEEFFTKYWEKEILHIHRNQESYFDEILSLDDIDNFLSLQNLIPDGMRVIDNGVFIDKRNWTSSETLLDGTVRVAVSPEKVLNYFQSGATIIINSAEKTMLKLSRACIAFEEDLNINVQANIYITPPNSKGFKLHYDLHDICLMQIKGPKMWNIYDSGEELPSSYAPFRNEPKHVQTLTINSGDFLYMPRGTVHEAFSSDTTTIHLNFSFKPRYGYHLLEELARVAEKNEFFFRHTIPNKYSTEQEKTEYIRLFGENLTALIEKTLPKDLLQKQAEVFDRRKTVNFQGNFKSVLKLEQLTSESFVSRKKDLQFVVDNTNAEVIVHFLNKKINIPRFVESELFFNKNSFQIKEVKGLISDQGKIDLIRQFIFLGFLELDDSFTS